ASCHTSPCRILDASINRKAPGLVRLPRAEEVTLQATARWDCMQERGSQLAWRFYAVASEHDVPDWSRPLRLPQPGPGGLGASTHIPKFSLPCGLYLVNFTLTVLPPDQDQAPLTKSDAIHVLVVMSPLKALLLGNAKETVRFSEGLVLNGTMSSDPDVGSLEDPLQGVQFSWYCTTNPGNYAGGHVAVTNKDVCRTEQTTLDWPWASGPLLTLSPETLKGDRSYHFRMVIRKGDRAAFSDKTVHVLQGTMPTAHISCIENCDGFLVISDRFSLSLNCTGCTSRDLYTWSILSPTGDEMMFDWVGQAVTRRDGAYLSIKAFAFTDFLEDRFWVSLQVAGWSGVTLDLRYSFVINHGPEVGECKINPAKGIAILTKFVIKCSNFKDKNIPLTYKVIVADLDGTSRINSVTENTLGAILYLGTRSTTPPTFLPVGQLVNRYKLKMYAQVYDSLGSFTQVTLYATVGAPTDRNPSQMVLSQLRNFTEGPTSLLSTLLQKQDWLSAGYLLYIVASILNNLKVDLTLQKSKDSLREHLVNQSFELPVSTLDEICQVVTAITKLTQKASEFTPVAQKRATVRLWEANQALQRCQRKDKCVHSDRIETMSTGIFMSLSNILKLLTPYEVFEDPFYVVESLADTIAATKVPGSGITALRTSNFNMYVEKVEKWDVTQAFRNKKQCPNCFHAALNASRDLGLPAQAPVSMMFCEFADDPFPWLSYLENTSAEVLGFRMTGTTDNGSVIEITPDVADVFLTRKHLTFATFNVMVGPSNEGARSSQMTTGGISFEVDSRSVKEVLLHIVTQVTVLFKVSVYAGSQVTPTDLVATFLVPHDTPPTANQSSLFDPTCTVKEARVVCLSPSLLQVIAQRSHSPKCHISVVLQAPRFVLQPTDQLVRIALFTVGCLDMYGIQNDWQEGTCALGEKTTWKMVHCVCRNVRRSRRQLSSIRLTNLRLHTRYVTAKVIVIPNPVDLQLKIIKNLHQNPVTLLAVLFIMFLYMALAFWALHRDEMDQFLWDHVVVLPDNDPYDSMCYLVTVFTGSRWGSGTRANVFVQLQGTENTSDVHCLSHPYFTTLYRGSINTFLLTTKSDLGDIHSIRVWHNNEGRAPSWYLSRIKVENLFSRQIWLFMCRKWLSVDTTLDVTFPATQPDQPLERKDFFLIDLSNRLEHNHMWFSIFSSVVAEPFNRLQRLSCCLAMLLSSLVCNIMFFNLNKKEQSGSREGRLMRSMMIGIESVIITIPVQLLITFFFTYSQKKPRVNPEEVAPQKHPLMSEEDNPWKERLDKWYAYEIERDRAVEAEKPISPSRAKPKAFGPTIKAKAPMTSKSNMSFTNNQDASLRAPSFRQDEHTERKLPIVLPWWCAYIAWFWVFAASAVSSFFIVFYGLTYGYDKSMEWLFASLCSFCQSVFLVQPCKIMLWSGARTNQLKYCKNLSWTSKYRYSEIKLPEAKMSPKEMAALHERIVSIQRSRMYQPLTEDEIRIFRRKKRIRRRALLFLSYLVTHFIFLALLLLLVALLRHSDTFYYNQSIRHQFSMDLAAVTKLEDIYAWLHNVFLPLLHNDLNPTFLLDTSSKILGLPLMRQVRAKPSPKRCLPAETFVQNGNSGEIRCHLEYGVDPEDREDYASFWNKVGQWSTDKENDGFIYKPPEKKWVYHSYGVLHTYGSGGYAFLFYPEQQTFNSTLRLQELQGESWLDEKTWAVILELTTFNADASLICSISVVFEVSLSGPVNSSLSVYSFSLADFNRKTSSEIYLYVAILIFFFAYIIDEGYVIKQERASYIRSVYNLLNFALKCLFTMLIMVFLRKHFLATDMIRFHLSNPEAFIPFHAVSQMDHTMRTILAFLLFLTILKTLRYSRFFYDVRLAQSAIQAALPGIFHMALVVSVYFFVYVAFGYLVFGQHEWNYSSMIHATQTVFSYCVSAFQNTEFSTNRVFGVLFLSSFMLVMICILINLFQAVILSAYEEMKQPVFEEPSEEVEAMAYLCGKLRVVFGFLTFRSKTTDHPDFCSSMLYGQPEKNSRQYLGLKTRNINGKKMVYLVL
uniref:Polycystin family receptor for egg jelly n=1 Tax=Jaculus jaculus TaxID=51337 RepID=A0A8C5L722_JACJA